MKLVFLVLNREELLENLLEGFIEIGITGATVIDSVGMGHILSTDAPLFAGLRFMFASSRPMNKTIISVIREEKLPELKTLVENILGSLNMGGNGILFVLNVEEVMGLKPEIS